MIKTTFLAIALFSCLFSVELIAQNNNSDDYIVLTRGDTLYGTVTHINTKSLSPKYYKRIRLVHKNGKKTRFKRTTINSFRANTIIYEGYWLNQNTEKITLFNPKYNISSKDGDYYFFKVKSKGPLSLYEYEWWEQGSTTTNWMYLIKKEDDSFFMRANQGLFGLRRKTLTRYFSDCPSLALQIENKEIKAITTIVSFYNNKCIIP